MSIASGRRACKWQVRRHDLHERAHPRFPRLHLSRALRDVAYSNSNPEGSTSDKRQGPQCCTFLRDEPQSDAQSIPADESKLN